MRKNNRPTDRFADKPARFPNLRANALKLFHLTYLWFNFSIGAGWSELSFVCHCYDLHILHVRTNGTSCGNYLGTWLVLAKLSHVRAISALLPLHLYNARKSTLAIGEGEARRCTQDPRNDGTGERQRVSGEFPQQTRRARPPGEATEEEASGTQHRSVGSMQVSLLLFAKFFMSASNLH